MWVAPCPFHNERSASFTVYPDHYHCFGCHAHGDAIKWLRLTRHMSFGDALAYLAGGYGTGPHRPAPAGPDRHSAGNPRKTEIARGIWSEAGDPRGTIVEAYLRSRGLELPDEPVLRFHPRCPYRDRRLPAMVALMSDPLTSDPRGIHRTFLLPDGSGKADVPRPKMMLGDGGVIRLAEPETDGLGLAEGIETALAVMQRVAWGPVWAAGNSGGIEHFPLLLLRTLNIFADHDDTGAGMVAAHSCAERWQQAGLEGLIHTPPPGEDWADAAGRIAP